jgi:hypothetical protein
MTPEDTDLITEFQKISQLMPGVAFDFIMGTLTPEREHEFGQILIALGELLVHRSQERRQPEAPTTTVSPVDG